MARHWDTDPTAHRTLKVDPGGRYLRGEDVKKLQRELNARLRLRDIDYRVTVDGEYGPKTHNGAVKALYYLGVTRASCGMGTKNPKRFTVRAQEYVRVDRTRNQAQRARGDLRVAGYKRGADATLRWARSKVGITESPPGSNKGPQISEWQEHWLGYDGYFWCGAFAGYALEQGGVEGLVGKNIVYTPAIVNDAKAGRNGFRSWTTSMSAAKKGDLVLYNWDGGVVDHVGIFTGHRFADGSIETIEGNTSKEGSTGSQSNGGGVFVRRRYSSTIEGFARPRWSR